MFTSWQRFGEVQQVPTGNLNLMIRNFSWGDKVVVGMVGNVQCSGCVFTDRCRYTVHCMYWTRVWEGRRRNGGESDLIHLAVPVDEEGPAGAGQWPGEIRTSTPQTCRNFKVGEIWKVLKFSKNEPRALARCYLVTGIRQGHHILKNCEN